MVVVEARARLEELRDLGVRGRGAEVAPAVEHVHLGGVAALVRLDHAERPAVRPRRALQSGERGGEARVVDVHVTSAAQIGGDEHHKLTAALERRFDRKVRVHADVDPTLIGGAVVRAGDLTIDGSYKSRLERLAYELTA